MGFFKQLEGDAAIIVINGVYKQVDLYTRDGYLYAKTAGGFVRLMEDGSTTKAKMRIDLLSFEGALHKDKFGRLCTAEVQDAKLLDQRKQTLLLGKPE